MKIYKVKVNGKVYEVELEEVKENDESIKKEEKNDSFVSEGSNIIKAPIAGKVLDIKVNVGDTINKGQTVAIIEAMKLENEIKSAYDGKVVEIKTNKGSQVNNGDILVVLG